MTFEDIRGTSQGEGIMITHTEFMAAMDTVAELGHVDLKGKVS